MTDQTTPTLPAVRGRPFPKGNGGRRPGSKNRSSLILAAVSDGDQKELVRKGLGSQRPAMSRCSSSFSVEWCRANE